MFLKSNKKTGIHTVTCLMREDINMQVQDIRSDDRFDSDSFALVLRFSFLDPWSRILGPRVKDLWFLDRGSEVLSSGS